MKKRRKNGEGTWGSKTIKGIDYRYYRDSDGTYTYGKTTKEIREKINKKAKEKQGSDLAADNRMAKEDCTFGEYTMDRLKKRAVGLRETTYDSYEDAINSRLLHFDKYDLAGKLLDELNDDVVQDWLNALAKVYSKNSIMKVWGPVRSSIIYGQAKGEIPEFPLLLITLPREENCRVPKKEIHPISPEHMLLLYEEAYRLQKNGQSVYGNGAKVIVMLMFSGLRISEAIGLKWRYVNLTAEVKTIRIKETLVRVKNRERSMQNKQKYVNKNRKPKNKSSEREVPLPKKAVRILQYFYENYPHGPNDYVFVTDNNTPFSKRNLERLIKNMQTALGITEDYTPHALRHGYASYLISQGADIGLVAELLGHSDVTTTYNYYVKAYKRDKERAVTIFDGLKNDS